MASRDTVGLGDTGGAGLALRDLPFVPWSLHRTCAQPALGMENKPLDHVWKRWKGRRGVRRGQDALSAKPLPYLLRPIPTSQAHGRPSPCSHGMPDAGGEPGTVPLVRCSERQSQRWGMPLCGAAVRGECPRHGAHNNREGIWVRAAGRLGWFGSSRSSL